MQKLKSIHRTGFRIMKMIHREDSLIIPLHLLKVALSLTQTYAGLFVTAEMIDALLLEEYRKAAGLALLLLGLGLLLGLTEQLLRRQFKGRLTKIWLIFYVWLREKAFSMDYETMENPEAAEKLLFSERTSDMYGGLGVLLCHYTDILQAILNIFLSVFLVGCLCASGPRGEFGLLGILARPLPSFLLFAGTLGGMAFCAFRGFGKFARRQMEIFQAHTGEEHKLMYLNQQIFGEAKVGKIIRIYGMEEMILHNSAEFGKRARAYFSASCDVGRAESNANRLVNAFFTVVTYFLVALKTVTGAVTVGAFTRYAGALNQFGGACFSVIAKHGELQKICIYTDEFLKFLDTENVHGKGSIPVEKRDDGEYELAFENVSFRYPGSEIPVLKNVNCRINIRGKMAVVGRNGAGKTTFIKLLCRLYDPTEGRITLNGVDIRKYSQEEYRGLFSVVFQDFKLFSFSVGENVAAGYEWQEEKLWDALRQAEADGFVRDMEKQLDTYLYKDLRDGVAVSGGEAQKLALARALYKDAPVVILDEPTAALDAKAEAQIYARFNEMVEGRTSIYISHRMSSCRFCDEIIVFHEGEIVERGSHEELYAAGGRYTQMWNAQARYYV